MGEPTGAIAEQIKKDFGSDDEFKKQFDVAGNTAFGSGWAWLSWDGSKLVVDKTIGAGNPITEGKKPVLTMDVWEHAYYLNYQNKRADYIVDFLGELVNWDFVNAEFARANKQVETGKPSVQAGCLSAGRDQHSGKTRHSSDSTDAALSPALSSA